MHSHYISLIFLTLFTAACMEEPAPNPEISGREVTLEMGKVYAAENRDLTIKIESIQDSRCPVGVYCFWQGEASVHLEVIQNEHWKIHLSTFLHPADTINNFIFKLIDVVPYPVYGTDIPDSEKRVILQIDPLIIK